jgi:hypothetical protein
MIIKTLGEVLFEYYLGLEVHALQPGVILKTLRKSHLRITWGWRYMPSSPG